MVRRSKSRNKPNEIFVNMEAGATRVTGERCLGFGDSDRLGFESQPSPGGTFSQPLTAVATKIQNSNR